MALNFVFSALYSLFLLTFLHAVPLYVLCKHLKLFKMLALLGAVDDNYYLCSLSCELQWSLLCCRRGAAYWAFSLSCAEYFKSISSFWVKSRNHSLFTWFLIEDYSIKTNGPLDTKIFSSGLSHNICPAATPNSTTWPLSSIRVADDKYIKTY